MSKICPRLRRCLTALVATVAFGAHSSAHAQDGRLDLSAYLERVHALIAARFPRPLPLPRVPIDQVFVCGLEYTATRTASSSVYVVQLHPIGTLDIDISLDTGGTISGSGAYTSLRGSGLLAMQATVSYALAGQPHQLDIALGKPQITYGLGMIRYFDVDGFSTEDGTRRPIRMFCQGAGHGYNAVDQYMRFVCPDYITAAGTYANTFELSPFVPGQAFRQRTYFAPGEASPTLIWRSEVGIYRRNGNDIELDFRRNPALMAFNQFPDTNELTAHLAQTTNGQVLVVDDLPPGANVCPQAP